MKMLSINPHTPNVLAISGALFTVRIQYEYTQTQYDEGARGMWEELFTQKLQRKKL